MTSEPGGGMAMTSEPGGEVGTGALATRAGELLYQTLTTLAAGDPLPADVDLAALPDLVREWLDDLLSKVDTYRDGALVLLAYPVAMGRPMDVTRPPDGRRGVGQRNAEVLRQLHIAHRLDPFQTIAKGSKTLIGRERAAWNALLTWASRDASFEEVRACFYYLAQGIVRTARQLPPMPKLDVQRLTFPKLAALLDDLFDAPSGGTYQQYVFAALLWARYVQREEQQRVETKPIHASDTSSRVPGDVQVVDRQEPVEAFEVTANDWTTKLAQADEARRSRDLKRAHVVADAGMLRGDQLRAEMDRQGIDPNVDLSVLDFRHEARSLVAELSKLGRRNALERLRVYLVEYQSDDRLVQLYVERLAARGLVAG